MTNAERAQVLVDGDPLPDGSSTGSVSDPLVAKFIAVDGNIYLEGLAAGSAVINITKDGRSGSLNVTVTDAPLVITLGTPEPK